MSVAGGIAVACCAVIVLSFFVRSRMYRASYLASTKEQRTGLLTGRPSSPALAAEDDLEAAFRQLEQERVEWFEPHPLPGVRPEPTWRTGKDGRRRYDVVGEE